MRFHDMADFFLFFTKTTSLPYSLRHALYTTYNIFLSLNHHSHECFCYILCMYAYIHYALNNFNNSQSATLVARDQRRAFCSEKREENCWVVIGERERENCKREHEITYSYTCVLKVIRCMRSTMCLDLSEIFFQLAILVSIIPC